MWVTERKKDKYQWYEMANTSNMFENNCFHFLLCNVKTTFLMFNLNVLDEVVEVVILDADLHTTLTILNMVISTWHAIKDKHCRAQQQICRNVSSTYISNTVKEAEVYQFINGLLPLITHSYKIKTKSFLLS